MFTCIILYKGLKPKLYETSIHTFPSCIILYKGLKHFVVDHNVLQSPCIILYKGLKQSKKHSKKSSLPSH